MKKRMYKIMALAMTAAMVVPMAVQRKVWTKMSRRKRQDIISVRNVTQVPAAVASM